MFLGSAAGVKLSPAVVQGNHQLQDLRAMRTTRLDAHSEPGDAELLGRKRYAGFTPARERGRDSGGREAWRDRGPRAEHRASFLQLPSTWHLSTLPATDHTGRRLFHENMWHRFSVHTDVCPVYSWFSGIQQLINLITSHKCENSVNAEKANHTWLQLNKSRDL